MSETNKVPEGLQILSQMFVKPDTIKRWKRFTQKSQITSAKEKHDSYSFLLISIWNLVLKGERIETRLHEVIAKPDPIYNLKNGEGGIYREPPISFINFGMIPTK